jgi:CheY-like chemotaxis protein
MERIIVVDDDPQVAASLSRVLRRRGFDVGIATSARTALAMLHAAPCDLLITDVVMPEMSGTQLLAEVRRQWPRLPCLLLSGYASLDDDAPVEGMMAPVLRKPWDTLELVSAIAQALEAARTGP